MRRLIPLLALALAATGPASARIAGSHPSTPSPRINAFIGDSRLPGPGIGRELRDIRGRIDRGRETGDLSRRDARQLRREARLIGRLADRYGRDGLSPFERNELDIRTQALRSSVSRPR
jgi:hypothetical protein